MLDSVSAAVVVKVYSMPADMCRGMHIHAPDGRHRINLNANRPVASKFCLTSYVSGRHLLLGRGIPSLGCAASADLRASCCLEHEGVVAGPVFVRRFEHFANLTTSVEILSVPKAIILAALLRS